MEGCVVAGVNDMATTHPSMAAEADGWDPATIVAGTAKKLNWICSLGHRWSTTGNARVTQGSGCPVCAGTKILPGYNDIATLYPELAAEAVGWDPRQVGPGDAAKYSWRCAEGHVWQAVPYPRTKGVGCPICSGQQVLAGYNDMATTRPDLAAEAVGWDPTTFMAGTSKKLRWRCAAGHEYLCTGGNRIMGSGCPKCAKYGFDPLSPGWLYLMVHDEWQMQQVGISNVPETRLGQHERHGWRPLDLVGPMDGTVARTWERAILAALEDLLAGVDRSSEAGGHFSGFTEAWPLAELDVSSILELQALVADDARPA
jgi:Probable Zinc-ribbon domain